MKKKIVFPLYSIIALCVVFLFSCFVLAVDILYKNGIYFYTGSFIMAEDIIFTILFCGSVLFVSAVAVFLQRNLKSKIIKATIIVISIIVALISIWAAFVSCVLFAPSAYVEIVSDDGEHTVIIGEDRYFFSPFGGDIFEKTSFCTMKKIGKYNADIDFYNPFSDGNYYTVWREDDFDLHFDSNSEGNYTTITIEYLK